VVPTSYHYGIYQQTHLITLGSLTLDSGLIVAEIEDEALLGLDILMKGKGGPADIKLTEGLILLDGIAIPCQYPV
jgi:hypothetical protein